MSNLIEITAYGIPPRLYGHFLISRTEIISMFALADENLDGDFSICADFCKVVHKSASFHIFLHLSLK